MDKNKGKNIHTYMGGIGGRQTAPRTVSLAGLGWCALGASIAVVRVAGGFAVGVQDHMRSGGIGAVWPTLRAARVRAGYLAKLHRLPVLEAI